MFKDNQDCASLDDSTGANYKTKMFNQANWSTEHCINSCKHPNENRRVESSFGEVRNQFQAQIKSSSRSCGDLCTYGWRKKYLYFLILGLSVMVIFNLSLTMWLFTIMQLSSEGIGAMRIMRNGIELTGQAVVLDNLIASTITSRQAKNLKLESWSNFSATIRAPEGYISAQLTLSGRRADFVTKSFKITNPHGNLIFSADKDEVIIGATLLKVTSIGGAVFHGSVQTSLVRSESGFGLMLESATRALEIRASERVVVESRAGEILTNSLLDLTLQSIEGAVKLDAKIIILKGLTVDDTVQFTIDDEPQKYPSVRRNRSLTDEKKPSVYQLCTCTNGKMFLAKPDGICRADNTIC